MQSGVILMPLPSRTGTLFVQTSSVISDSLSRWMPRSLRAAWLTQAMISFAPCSLSSLAAAVSVPAVSVRSSTRITERPSTSPMRVVAETSVGLLRRLATMARLVSSACA